MPFTDDILFPQRVEERIFKKIFENNEPFEPLVMPYIANLPVEHLQKLITHFEA
jgi:hypothetical protein